MNPGHWNEKWQDYIQIVQCTVVMKILSVMWWNVYEISLVKVKMSLDLCAEFNPSSG
jgi:hypothetical protein